METALYLVQSLNTTPEYWLNLQMHHDLWLALQEVEEIPPIQEVI